MAAIIVCGIGTIIALRAHPFSSWKMRPVQATSPPTRGRNQASTKFHAGNFNGIEAPWALSALPACLIPQSVYRAKNTAAVLAHLPKGAQPVAQGTSLTYRDCTILVRRNDAEVVRGNDRFHIPPQSSFYKTATKLVFVRFARWAELRVYTVSNI